MASITIRNLDDKVKARLRIAAGAEFYGILLWRMIVQVNWGPGYTSGLQSLVVLICLNLIDLHRVLHPFFPALTSDSS